MTDQQATGEHPPASHWFTDRPPRWLPRAVVWTTLIVLLAFTSWWAVGRLHNLLIILVSSMFLAFAIEPGVNWLAARGWRRGWATLAIYAGIFVVAVGLIALMGALVVQQVADLAKSLPDLLTSVADWVDRTFNVDLAGELDKLSANLAVVGTTIATNAIAIGATIIGSIFNIATVMLFAFYLAAEGPQFRRSVCSMLPPSRQHMVLEVWELAVNKTAGYLYSRVVLATASAAVSSIVFAIMGIPYALTLGIFVGIVSQFLPTVGTYIAGALPIMVALTVSPLRALAVLIFILAYQQFENYILTPPLASRTMALHPAVAFGSVIAGAALLGAVGALVALPATATIQAFVSTYIRRHDLVESDLFDSPMSKRQAARAAAADDAEAAPPPEAPAVDHAVQAAHRAAQDASAAAAAAGDAAEAAESAAEAAETAAQALRRLPGRR